MKFKKIRMEEDYEYNYWEDNAKPQLIGETMGCSCCVKRIPITKENLREQIDSLREELILSRDLFRTLFGEISE